MDAVLYCRYRRSDGTDEPLEWEFSAGVGPGRTYQFGIMT